jgi:hypothetical protein
MLILKRQALPASEVELRAALQAYLRERQAHAQTEGVPAPLPAYEVLAVIANDPDQNFEIQDEVGSDEMTFEQRRRQAYDLRGVTFEKMLVALFENDEDEIARLRLARAEVKAGIPKPAAVSDGEERK